ncbi:M20/M25/M40 family metallo-hydrolase [Compostimonas suwonensis]|uniref:Carboxypeptidase PM20D1 n=1 Tax=Compostimonas suwonensis TaxID=1048394 RepID=A0A2M9BU69_9MICO|nr:M20/M25/M40 family metallo-hydrolase [Compostimonas suwonensis]PJJ61462.1 carboxypeptidase PM20D1 [Compostimonas suwonensis]
MSDADLERFRSLLRMATVSSLTPDEVDWSRFASFADLVEQLYPRVHEHLAREIVDGHTLLWHWVGRETGDPTVLMAHYDVVSVVESEWSSPPFEARLVGDGGDSDDDSQIVARGVLDDKGSLVALLEAIEGALESGYQPLHDVYLLSTHDEEVAGSGAPAAVALFASRGIRPGFVLDEGGSVREGILPGVERAIAVVGVTERGIINLELLAKDAGGHASTPPPPPALLATQRIARAIDRLSRRPFPATVPAPIAELVRTAAPYADAEHRELYTSPGRNARAIVRALNAHSNRSAAMLRTTVAITQLRGSAGANVLATRASAVANIRVNPGSSVAAVIERVARIIDDPLVELRVLSASEPSPVSPTGAPGDGGPFSVLRETISEVFPEAIVAPYVQTGGSDARHFAPISDRIYRFIPFEITPALQLGVHGADERLPVSQFRRAIGFYRRLLERL